MGHRCVLPGPATQVVEFGPPHVAAGGDLEFLDLRRVQRERPLDADAKRLLADREGLADAGALPLEDDPLKDLGASAAALDDLEVDAHAVARREGRKSLPLLAPLDAVGNAAHWRAKAAGPTCSRPAASESDLPGIFFQLPASGTELLAP